MVSILMDYRAIDEFIKGYSVSGLRRVYISRKSRSDRRHTSKGLCRNSEYDMDVTCYDSSTDEQYGWSESKYWSLDEGELVTQ